MAVIRLRRNNLPKMVIVFFFDLWKLIQEKLAKVVMNVASGEDSFLTNWIMFIELVSFEENTHVTKKEKHNKLQVKCVACESSLFIIFSQILVGCFMCGEWVHRVTESGVG